MTPAMISFYLFLNILFYLVSNSWTISDGVTKEGSSFCIVQNFSFALSATLEFFNINSRHFRQNLVY